MLMKFFTKEKTHCAILWNANEILLLKFNIFSNMTLFNLTIFAIIIKKKYLKHIWKKCDLETFLLFKLLKH